MKISITEYLHNKDMQENSLFTIENGKGYYTLKGVRFETFELQKIFPTSARVKILSGGRYKGDSIDSRTNWRQ